MVGVTAFQIFFLIRADRNTARQIALASAVFISSNRPRLVVRDVHAPKRDPGQRITVKFSLVNIGQTRATLGINAINITYRPPGSAELVLPPAAAGRRDLPVTVIEPGGQRPFKLKTASDLKWDDNTLKVQAAETVGVFLEGKVIYADDRGIPRRLVFRYQWQGFQARFRRISDPDYDDE